MSARVMRLEAELALGARAEVGEGPVWDEHSQRLIWVDVTRDHVHSYDPAEGRNETLTVDQPVGVAVRRARGGLAVAVRDGFAFLEPHTGSLELIAEVEPELPDNRMNDGKCDAAGRFFAGTMPMDGDRPTGALYRLDPDHRVTRVLDGITISNGLDWSLDGRTMYYIDSATHRVSALDYDPGSGAVANRRPLITFPDEYGLPDGMTVDAAGFLWVAFWEGSSVRRFSPDGALDLIVELPVSLVTSCCFGGPELADLYITSASVGVSETESLAGGIFRVRPGVKGRPQNAFAG